MTYTRNRFDAKLPVVPLRRDIGGDEEVFLGEPVIVGHEHDGTPVSVHFGGHVTEEGDSSLVIHLQAGNQVLELPAEAAEALGLELVRQTALGQVVANQKAVSIDLDLCKASTRKSAGSDPSNWPVGRSNRGKKVA
ncbi:hypothetical protein [Prescottella agglutinans]|uniref:Uncharacterized protein n=1 Tax=Prescottella agglutinans TaxID=1644129 RepID=A0ABT6MI53_9NOCA|nr:hypothetical protein [Prescottella agglutinans]MDH6283544.1 hypothetical protein [Prescottella agglutinans]